MAVAMVVEWCDAILALQTDVVNLGVTPHSSLGQPALDLTPQF